MSPVYRYPRVGKIVQNLGSDTIDTLANCMGRCVVITIRELLLCIARSGDVYMKYENFIDTLRVSVFGENMTTILQI